MAFDSDVLFAEGGSLLDLGACLGAMCHYALCAGASRAVAVEVQPDFYM